MSTQALIKRIHGLLRNSETIRTAYHKIQDAVQGPPSYDISEVTPVNARTDACDHGALRLNLLVPSVDQKHVFGGIATAVRFFEQLVAACDCEARVIAVDAPVVPEASTLHSRYTIVSSQEDSEARYQLVGYSDRYQKTIPVRKNDVFVVTAWWTAYTIKSVIAWQAQTFCEEMHPLIYLIQDYEPGFYAWSSRYLMADSTYRLEQPVYAIFNSKLLKEFFDKNGYHFTKSWYFDPVLNNKLKEFLPDDGTIVPKKKQIILYGRPGTMRNAFEVVVSALKIWVWQQPDIDQWTICSAGETHPDVDLGNGKVLRSVGKLTLEEYAQMMLDTYAGISLMVSPHPSYPPLEMATFGIRTITNCYDNKDLCEFSDKMVSLKQCAPENVAQSLLELCSNYAGQSAMHYNEAYINGSDEFGTSVEEIAKTLR